MAKGIADATLKIYEQLEKLAPEERGRAVDAALTMLGEPASRSRSSKSDDQPRDETSANEYPTIAKSWISKNNIESSALAEMFHFENGKVQLIHDKGIGASKRQQTVSA